MKCPQSLSLVKRNKRLLVSIGSGDIWQRMDLQEIKRFYCGLPDGERK
jgi:hypothetical protein